MKQLTLAADDIESLLGVTITDDALPPYVLGKVSKYLYLLDASHPEFPIPSHLVNVGVSAPIQLGGVGTQLKKLLGKFGLAAAPGCACNARAAEMDINGIEWCESNVDTIVGWLREQAQARGLPFLDVAGRLLIRRAIKNARKNKIDQ
jgi:hypothetical protein